jgi:hypothetical protein
MNPWYNPALPQISTRTIAFIAVSLRKMFGKRAVTVVHQSPEHNATTNMLMGL